MNEQDSKAQIFDVFLCHNSVDKPAVREIALELSKENIRPWMDESDIKAGSFWPNDIGEQIETAKSAAVFVGGDGVGPWQSREIFPLLKQLDKRQCPVIPVVLPSAKTTQDLPWYLESLHRVDFRTDSHPLKRLIWGITGQKPKELSDVLSLKRPGTSREAEGRSDNVTSEARLYPPLAESPDQDNATQLNILRKKVTEYWVDGVLKHSLYNEVLIPLGNREIDNAVPWKYTGSGVDATNSAPLDHRDLSVIHDAAGLLLILGEPGAGKTTTLLDLARTLLERAKDDIKERVPVVLNLSSWKNKQPLAEWISAELSEKYWVPKKIGRLWLQHNYLLPLLDGLDEIETSMQPDCVAAINAFIEEFQPSGLVVCCRLNEYRWLPKRLKLNGAICIEPLGPDEMSKYFAAGGSKLAGLREAIDADPVLQGLAQTPLMLSIMSLAYQGGGGDELAAQKGDSPEGRRKQIFRLYVQQMFKREGRNSILFPEEKTIGWLSWLAGKMRYRSQSEFFLEGLQPSWLGSTAERAAYKIAAVLSLLLSVGLIVTLIGESIYGLGAGLFGLLVTLAFVRNPLDNIALLHPSAGYWTWCWNRYWKGVRRPSIATGELVVALIVLLIVALIVGSKLGLIFGLIVPPIYWAIAALLIGIGEGYTNVRETKKESANQLLRLTLKHCLIVFLAFFLVFLLIFGLIAPSLLKSEGLFCFFFALIFALNAGANQGGSAVIFHYVLRFVLWFKGYTPLNLVKFLDHCARLILLKKVGGGYIFIHRMLLDYFADIPAQDTSVKR